MIYMCVFKIQAIMHMLYLNILREIYSKNLPYYKKAFYH